MAAIREWKVGEQSFRFEPPDLLVARVRDTETDEQTGQIMKALADIGQVQPFYLVVDLTDLKAISTPRRQEVSKSLRMEWFLGCAYVNANLVVKMAIRAINAVLLLTGKSIFETAFVANEAEARTAIEAMRRKRALRKA